jgi:5-methylcytosine-specific restriction enzyme subunit McrC
MVVNVAPLLPEEEWLPCQDVGGYIGRIPVRNLWVLMLYASDLFRTGGTGKVGLEDSPDDLPDLIAEILAHAVEVRQRRHLSSGYRARNAILNRVRGRIDVLKTERHQLLERGLIACKYDELTIDTPRNRHVCAALERISRIVRRKKLAYRCRALANGLRTAGVIGLMPTRAEMSTELALPTESAGAQLLAMPEREVIWVRKLFERAVGGFYEVALKPQGWRVKCGGMLTWQTSQKTAGIDAIFPTMKTDIVLDHAPTFRRIVIDTKFTSIVTNGWRRDETLRSGYIYQIYAYLRSQVGGGDVFADSASGLLLHPSMGETVDEEVTIQGHNIRFGTVDLMAEPGEIRSQLLRFTNSSIS